MRALNTLQTLLSRRPLASAAVARARADISSCHAIIPQGSSFSSSRFFAKKGAPLQASSSGISNKSSFPFFSNKTGCRCLASEATSDSSSSNISFEPDEVSRRLIDLAKKYCKEGCDISPSQIFDSLETREDRPWDCLDTVEFLLDAEDIFGLVIPDEAADGFNTIQDVVTYISQVGKKGDSD